MPNIINTDPPSSGGGRQLTEKRKTQNREAQRKYRQKIKNRLETLERELAEKTQRGEAPQAESVDTKEQAPLSVGTIPTDRAFEDFETGVTGMDIDDLAAFNNLESGFGTDGTEFYALANNHTETFLDPLSNDVTWDSELPPQSSLNTSRDASLDSSLDPTINLSDTSIWDMSFGNSTAISNASYLNSFPASNALPIEWEANQPPGFQSLPTYNDYNSAVLTPDKTSQSPPLSGFPQHRKLSPPQSGEHFNASDLGIELMQQLRLDDTKEHRSLVKTAVARGLNIRDVLLAGLGALANVSSPPVSLAQTLNLNRMSTLQAYLANAKAMQFPIEVLYDEEGISPFYQASPKAPPETALILPQYAKLHPSLRPTKAQLLYPHHPWLDLIPFPSFRQRVLVMNAMSPPPFDIYQLKNDIFMNDGLTCWRTGGKGSGQPWDMRSWEAQKWFLEKYRYLISPDCDVAQQTNWWKAIRGEKVS